VQLVQSREHSTKMIADLIMHTIA